MRSPIGPTALMSSSQLSDPDVGAYANATRFSPLKPCGVARGKKAVTTVDERSTAVHTHDACAAWLPDPPPDEQHVADFLAGRTFIWTAAVGGESRRPFGHVVALQPPLVMRRNASAQLGWVEVLRRKASVPEGWSNSGCWFHQATNYTMSNRPAC